MEKNIRGGFLKEYKGREGVFGKNAIFFLLTQGNRGGGQLAGAPSAGVPGHGGGRRRAAAALRGSGGGVRWWGELVEVEGCAEAYL